MNDKISKIQKSSREFSIFLKVLIIVLGIGILITVGTLGYAISQNSSTYELKEYADEFNDKNYSLMIDGKETRDVIIDKYEIDLETGQPNYKASFIIELIIDLVKLTLILPILLIVYRMLNEIRKVFKPFTLINAKRLRIISILIFTLTCLPACLELCINFFIFLKASVIIAPISIMVFLLGIAVWGISYVLEYGCVLQEDVDGLI